MADRARVGVVGTGFIGPVHVEALRRIGAEVVGLVGSSPNAARCKGNEIGVPAYDSLDDLLKVPELTSVHVTTPNYLHAPMVEQVIAAGKHVVCEKPLAMNVAEGERLLRLAREAGVVHAVNFNIRFYPLCQQARAMVHSGEVGRLYGIHGSYLQDWLLRESDWNWRLEPELGGEMRAVADIGSHWLDLVEFIAGQRVTRVFADFTTILPARRKPTRPVETFAGKELTPDEYEERPIRTEDFATVLLRFADGAPGVMTVSQVSAGHKNRLVFEINGADASLAWNSERPEELWIGRRECPSEQLQRDPALLAPEARATTSYPGGHAEGFPDTFKALYHAVYRAIATGTPPAAPNYPTFVDGVRALRLGEAIAMSAREDRWVDVPEGDA
ncbi:MAG TPA: Gfo/Idh/MocA family oxidoreductase [Thermomicrobiales bacterium]|nr:Gfo/Idh/MocA family oxidoreductase [Thermomicrobiales bacterium]